MKLRILLIVALTATGVFIPTTSQASTVHASWLGTLQLAASASTVDSSNPQATLTFSESIPIPWGYAQTIYDESNHLVRACTYPIIMGCTATVTIPFGATKTYTAYISWDYPTTGPPTDWYRIAGPVSITHVGWLGTAQFSASAPTVNSSNPQATLTLSESAPIPWGYAQVIYDESNHRVGLCTYPTVQGCITPVTIPFEATKTYVAYISTDYPATGPPNDVLRSAGSASVTNVGWSGHFTSAEATVRDEAFLGATSATFEWDQPLDYVWVDVIDGHGAVIGTCSAVGSLSCSAALALGPDESEVVHAEARAGLPGGGHVTAATSAAVELTGMDSNAYAEFLAFAPEASLATMLGAARAEQVVEIRTAVQSETFCAALGTRLPSNVMFKSTVPDATLLCMSGTAAFMGYLIGTMGVDVALLIMTDAADTDTDLGAPSYDPEVRGTIFNDPDCHFYRNDGTCLEYPDLVPTPDVEALADGARRPPPPDCMDDAARDSLIASMSVQNHHIITRYANQAPEGADDVLLEREANVDRLQAIVADYGLGINADWNILRIPHAGPHPSGYHAWVRQQTEAIDQAAGGDATTFLSLWDILIRKVIAIDPTIVRNAYWECRG